MPIDVNYPTSAAGVFAIHARRPRLLEFPCSLECSIGHFAIHVNDQLTVRPLGNGLLYELSAAWSGGEPFAYLEADAINRLAGFELVKE